MPPVGPSCCHCVTGEQKIRPALWPESKKSKLLQKPHSGGDPGALPLPAVLRGEGWGEGPGAKTVKRHPELTLWRHEELTQGVQAAATNQDENGAVGRLTTVGLRPPAVRPMHALAPKHKKDFAGNGTTTARMGLPAAPMILDN
jgi:hypothetical protein